MQIKNNKLERNKQTNNNNDNKNKDEETYMFPGKEETSFKKVNLVT